MQQDPGPARSKNDLDRLAAIHKSVDRMGNLIDDLLAFSHSGRLQLVKKPINLDELVQDTLADFQAQRKARNITWTCQPLPTVQADRNLLRMALVNLMSNAVKFTGTRAEPKITIGCSANGKRKPWFSSKTMALAPIQTIPTNCSGCFNACTAPMNLRAQALGWPTSSALFIATVDGYGPRVWWMAARHFTFHCRKHSVR
jgi:signal transduction histidine kinase